ncbi:MFS transporter [Kitasatospora sp. NBC_00240]|uniref:MFS transporter n=1 Tax=Kitasatospora sp. NBC_00240 TaxID=2903567 RepID=UPI0022530D87|nr:MFS transporter [Kitasatospora sp. NBC_00240]MCX5211661.1 MFS transporter [Kitasatospora sp. NBC_00240]
MTVLDQTPLPPAAPKAPATMTGRQRLVLVVLLAAQFMLAVDFSILNVALPVIGRGLGFPLGGLQWIVTAFALSAAGFSLLFGRVADLFGRRRVFLVGLAVLAASSLVGGLATTPWVLLAARVAQGLATAAVTPAGLALLTTAFPEGPLRERALGLNGALMSAGFTSGAVLGGLLTDLLSWRWAFFVNVPVALAVLLVAPRLVPESAEGRGGAERPRIDLPGAAAVTGGLLALVYGLTRAGEHGWGDPLALGALAVGALLLVAFRFVERAAAHPLVPVRVLRRRTVVWGNLAGLIAFATETSLVFLMTLYLQRVLGFSPLATGLAFAVLGAGTVLGGIRAPRVIRRLGTRNTLVTGLLVQAAATAALLLLGTGTGWLALLLAATFVGGVGNMLAIVGFMVTATSGLPDHEQGLATGVATMTQQVGITLGTPVMSAVVTARMTALGGGTATATVLGGVGVAVLANTVLVLLGAAASGAFLRRRGE